MGAAGALETARRGRGPERGVRTSISPIGRGEARGLMGKVVVEESTALVRRAALGSVATPRRESGDDAGVVPRGPRAPNGVS